MQHSIDDMIAENDRVVLRVTSRGTHRGDFQGVAPTDRRVEFTGIVIYRIAGHKIAESSGQARLSQTDPSPAVGRLIELTCENVDAARAHSEASPDVRPRFDILLNTSVLWRRLNQPGHEAALLSEGAAGAVIEGTAVFSESGRPCRLDYRVVCDAAWRTLLRSESWAGWPQRRSISPSGWTLLS